MKQLSFYLIFAGLSILSLPAFKPAATSHTVDLKKSSLSWTGYKVTGKHSGNIMLKSGELKFEGTKLTGGSFEIDMNSISSTDLTGEYADKLVGHLKANDFFGTANHPVAKFKMTSAGHQGKDLYKITGDLTIKGITKPIKFNATVKEENGVKVADALIKIDRTDYDIKYGSGSFIEDLGDKTIYDEFDLAVKLVTSK
jgi:polyisoprenoid-binding protein YceI